jgi:hypothetical protein
MTNFKTDNSNSTLWTADVIYGKFCQKRKERVFFLITNTAKTNFLSQVDSLDKLYTTKSGMATT